MFLTGATGYIGTPLAAALRERGHAVRSLVRPQSAKGQCGDLVVGNALDCSTWTAAVQDCDTFVHLVGTAHPSPAKAREFRRVDLVSIGEAVKAARGLSHVYVSVAHPAPVMQAYIAVREEGEALIREAGLNATIFRPWYVLGPGHRWPYLLVPVYALARKIPALRDGATRLGLLTLQQMLRAMVAAIENPPLGIRVLEVQDIRELGR